MTPADLLIEASVLLACGRGDEIAALAPPRGAAWVEAHRLAGLHRIRPFVLHHLSLGDSMHTDEWAAAQLELKAFRAESSKLLDATRLAIAILAEAGIEAVVVKGVTSLGAVFSGLPYRTGSDVDLVIRSGSTREADRALTVRGLFRQELVNRWQAGLVADVFGRRSYSMKPTPWPEDSTNELCGGPLTVDLHWAPRYAIGGETIEIESDGILARKRLGDDVLKGIPIAAPDDALALELAHHISDAAENRASLRSAIETIFRAARAGDRAEIALSAWPPYARARAMELLELSRRSEASALRRYLGSILRMNPAAAPPLARRYVLSRLSTAARLTYIAGYFVPVRGRRFLEHYANLAARVMIKSGFSQ